MFLPLILIISILFLRNKPEFPTNATANTKFWYPHHEGGPGLTTSAHVHIVPLSLARNDPEYIDLLRLDDKALIICLMKQAGDNEWLKKNMQRCDALQIDETLENGIMLYHTYQKQKMLNVGQFLYIVRGLESEHSAKIEEYVRDNKPIFNIEYESDRNKVQEICRKSAELRMNTVIKFAIKDGPQSMIQCSSPFMSSLNEKLAGLKLTGTTRSAKHVLGREGTIGLQTWKAVQLNELILSEEEKNQLLQLQDKDNVASFQTPLLGVGLHFLLFLVADRFVHSG